MVHAKFSHLTEKFILLLLICNCRLHAAVLTYDGCMNNIAYSYKVGGWCFLLYQDSSWPNNFPDQDGAQTACLPYGSLAVGVTKSMLQYFVGLNLTGSRSWIAMNRNTLYPNNLQGWYWNTLLPSGDYASFPVVTTNILWGMGQPANDFGNEYAANLKYNFGVGDVRKNMTAALYGAQKLSIICQFAPRQWRYPKRGHGRFNATSGYQIEQTNTIKLECFRRCHAHPGCISMTYNPTTQDCQTYSVSPEDPGYVSMAVADNTYDWYIRDGMEY